LTWFRRLALIVAGFVVIAGGAALLAWRGYAGPGPLPEMRTVVVPKGAGVQSIAALLAERGVIDSAYLFMAGARAENLTSRLRAGEFAFTAQMSARDVARHLAFGQPVMRRITVAEGLTSAQAVALVAAAEGMEGMAPTVEEGAILPETYLYTWGDNRAELVARMKKSMIDALAASWQKRAADLAIKTPSEALVLASLIEKETALAGERPLVSGVFHNRLKRGMKLQSDPTIPFGPTHNTYVIAALPPTPIANPGRAAIEAALNPGRTDALYFVADGTGGHVFAKTLEEHNRNVARWRRIQPQQQP
jgi:UPF0755 protein